MNITLNAKEAVDIILEAVSTEPIDCPNCDGTGKHGDKDCLVCHGSGRISINESAETLHPFTNIAKTFGYSYSHTEKKQLPGELVDKFVFQTALGGQNNVVLRLWSYRGGHYWSINDSVSDNGNLAFGLEKRLKELSLAAFNTTGYKLGSATDKALGVRNESIQNPNSSGQGYDPDFKSHPWASTVLSAGYAYSHSTPVIHQSITESFTTHSKCLARNTKSRYGQILNPIPQSTSGRQRQAALQVDKSPARILQNCGSIYATRTLDMASRKSSNIDLNETVRLALEASANYSSLYATYGPYTAYSEADRAKLQAELQKAFPYANVTRSTLGGENRASLLITVSADKRETWSHGILENSRYAKFHLSNRKVECISRNRRYWLAARKSTVRDVNHAATKIIAWSPAGQPDSNGVIHESGGNLNESDFPGLGLAAGIASGVSQVGDMVKRKLGIKTQSEKDSDARWNAAVAAAAKSKERLDKKIKASGMTPDEYAKAKADKKKATDDAWREKAKKREADFKAGKHPDGIKRDSDGKFA